MGTLPVPCAACATTRRRRLSTDPTTAALYRRAGAVVLVDRAAAVAALAAAVQRDRRFAVATVDLAVLTGRPVPRVKAPGTRWERRHVELVSLIAAGETARARALLFEHVGDGGCDPMACALLGAEA